MLLETDSVGKKVGISQGRRYSPHEEFSDAIDFVIESYVKERKFTVKIG